MSEGPSSFSCPHCGQSHEGYPTDYGYTLPDDVWAIPEEERASLAKWNSDLCQLGERYFVRCVLSIRFVDRAGYFGWGLWAEVERPVFERYLEIYEQDAASEPPALAKIANQPPGYEAVVGAPVSIQFGLSTERPKIQIAESNSSTLALEQLHGISSARYHEILESMGVIEP
jgi:hypothetical protein